MIKRIVSFALHQPLFILLMTVLFIGGGVAAFLNLPIEAFPDVSDIQVNVITLFPGQAPDEVEKQMPYSCGAGQVVASCHIEILPGIFRDITRRIHRLVGADILAAIPTDVDRFHCSNFFGLR